MREVVGDLFDYPADALCIPVNWTVTKNGDAVMGAGVAREAATRWPWLPAALGTQIKRPGGPSVVSFQAHKDDSLPLFHVACLPTKHDWRQPSTLGLVELGAKTLVDVANRAGWQTVALPRLGCGLGQLIWADVRAVLAPILDDRFVVCSREGEQDGR